MNQQSWQTLVVSQTWTLHFFLKPPTSDENNDDDGYGDEMVIVDDPSSVHRSGFRLEGLWQSDLKERAWALEPFFIVNTGVHHCEPGFTRNQPRYLDYGSQFMT